MPAESSCVEQERNPDAAVSEHGRYAYDNNDMQLEALPCRPAHPGVPRRHQSLPRTDGRSASARICRRPVRRAPHARHRAARLLPRRSQRRPPRAPHATKSGKSSPARTCSVPSPTPRRRRAASSSALWRSASPANSARPDSNASAALIAPKKPRQAPACGAFPFRRFRFFLTPTPGRTSPKRRRRPRASLRTRA